MGETHHARPVRGVARRRCTGHRPRGEHPQILTRELAPRRHSSHSSPRPTFPGPGGPANPAGDRPRYRGHREPDAPNGRTLVGMARSGVAVVTAGAMVGLGYYLVVTGKLTLDTGWGRPGAPPGSFGGRVAAPAQTGLAIL